MKQNPQRRSNRVNRLLALSIFFLLLHNLHAEMGLRLPPFWSPIAPLDVPDIYTFSLIEPKDRLDFFWPRSLNHTVIVDSMGLVQISMTYQNSDIFNPLKINFQEYLDRRIFNEYNRYSQNYAASNYYPTKDTEQDRSGFTIESPRIRSEAFKRVFGGETLSLRVDGDITIDGGMRNETRSRTQDAANRRPNTSFQMKQTQRFQVQGKIGENVSIYVDQDSERPFEFENAVKLEYKGDEDAIVQSIEAGNVSLSLPSTQLVTFSTQNSGLFGIKTHLKLGNLDVTAIASMQKGEKKKKSFKGGKEDQVIQINDYDYRRHTYFFVDYYYRNQFPNYDENGKHLIDPSKTLSQIEVYKSGPNYIYQDGSIRAWATITGEPDTSFVDEETFKGYFLRLKPLEDYFVQPELGYIYMNNTIQEGEVLAVVFRDTSGNQVGDFVVTSANLIGTPIFRMIKPRTPRPSDETWNLEWKNVYTLGIQDITQEEFDEGLKMTLFFKSSDGDPKQSTVVGGQTISYLEIFGLDRFNKNGLPDPDGEIDNNPNIINKKRGELIFPDLKPFDPVSPASELPSDQRTPELYDTTNVNYIRQKSKFYLEVKSSRRATSFNLDMNIIEGTEEVYLDGKRMTKDIDYTIDYTFGTLTMLNPNASNPNAEIEINYESQQLFTIDKKSLFGARAEYTLWETGNKRSFVGATILYMDQHILERRIRVGKDAPMKNLLWDVNTSLNFQPDFITQALDALPILDVSAPSTISFEGEVAQVIPNPNTLNSKATGDDDGVAYLDDFEGARRQTSLGVIRKNWTPSSQPMLDDAASLDLSTRGHLIWYNPIEMVPIKDIWPNRETTTNYGGTNQIQVLNLVLTPCDTLGDLSESWGGIQRFLPTGYADQTDSRFLEIWIKGTHGRLNINLGQISEDAIPNNRWDTEDKATETQIQNNLLDSGEDTGLDGMRGDDPPYLFYPHVSATVSYSRENGRDVATGTPFDFWDLNRDGQKQPNEPWSYDDFKYENRSNNYDQINGTENNINDGTQTPDTEDLNGNSDIDISNNYFEYSFSLALNHPDTVFIAGGKKDSTGFYPEDGWRLYRLPLDNPSRTINGPDMSRIEFARIWIDSATQKTSISIAEINLTGNEWKLRGTRSEKDSTFFATDDSTMTIAVINSHDNPEYTPPNGVKGEYDPVQKIRSKEQSLVIGLNDLQSGFEAIAQKQFYQPQDLMQYRKLKMFLHGGGANNILGSDSIEFFLQWGSDTENLNYYEIRVPQVLDSWEGNDIEVSFEMLSTMKIRMLQDSLSVSDTTLSNGHRLSIHGKPSLRNIRWLILGVKNKGPFSFTGELWIDELRVSSVLKDKGMAIRLRTDINLSDFISVSAEYERKDADFHRVTERFGSGSNSSEMKINANMKFDKMLPSKWGLLIPVSATFSRATLTPKYFPNSDILVNERTADKNFLESIQDRNTNMALNLALSRQIKSDNGFLRLLLDPWSGRVNYTNMNQSNSQIKEAVETRWQGNINYNLSFNKNQYIQPFKWLGEKGFLRNFAKTRFFYLPNNLEFQAEVKDIGKSTEFRDGRADTVKTALFTRNFSTAFQPFSALSMDFSTGYKSDMQENGESKWEDLFSSLSPGDARSRTQQVGTSFNPKLFAWLTNNLKYTANYQWENNPQIKESGNSARVNTNLTLGGTLNFKTMVQSLRKEPSSKAGPRRPVMRNKPEEEKQSPAEQKKSKGFSQILTFFGRFIEKLEPININYRQTQTDAQYGILDGENPSFGYMLGLDLDPEVRTAGDVSTDQSSERSDRSMTIGSGFTLFEGMTAKLDYDISSTRNISTQKTGDFSTSSLNMKENVSIPFPGWSIQWSGLEKTSFIKSFVKSITLSHQYSGKKTETWNGSPDRPTQETFTSDFRPLIGMSIGFVNGITTNITYSMSENLTLQKAVNQDQKRQSSSDLAVTARYSMKGGFKIPFLKNKRLENNIDFNLTFSKKDNRTEQRQGDNKKFQEMAGTKSWSFQPRIDYTFSRTVKGGLSLELGKRKDVRMGTTSIKAFNLHAAISLSGQ